MSMISPDFAVIIKFANKRKDLFYLDSKFSVFYSFKHCFKSDKQSKLNAYHAEFFDNTANEIVVCDGL